MCTAATYKTKDFYFGRTLDYDFSYAEKITITPRNFVFSFRESEEIAKHYAIIGMAYVKDNYPLYYDAVNEKGLCMAGLNFVGNACYRKPQSGKINLAQFEFIPYILCKCVSVKEALAELKKINLADISFNDELPPAELHWIVADRNKAITVEFVKEGLKIYDNPAGILTNNPPFPEQLFNLNNLYRFIAERSEEQFFKGTRFKNLQSRNGRIGLARRLIFTVKICESGFRKTKLCFGSVRRRKRQSVLSYFRSG